MAKPKLLFVCYANINRSRTAEDIFAGSKDYEVQSAGFVKLDGTGQQIDEDLFDWADKIFVMDVRQSTHLHLTFDITGKGVFVLGIPDIYNRGDEELIKILKEKLNALGITV